MPKKAKTRRRSGIKTRKSRSVKRSMSRRASRKMGRRAGKRSRRAGRNRTMRGGSNFEIRLGRCGDTGATPEQKKKNKSKFMCIEQDNPKARVNVNLNKFNQNPDNIENFKNSLSAASTSWGNNNNKELLKSIRSNPTDYFNKANYLLLLRQRAREAEAIRAARAASVIGGPIAPPFPDDESDDSSDDESDDSSDDESDDSGVQV